MGALGQERVGSAGQAISMAQDLRSLLRTAQAENPDALRSARRTASKETSTTTDGCTLR